MNERIDPVWNKQELEYDISRVIENSTKCIVDYDNRNILFVLKDSGFTYSYSINFLIQHRIDLDFIREKHPNITFKGDPNTIGISPMSTQNHQKTISALKTKHISAILRSRNVPLSVTDLKKELLKRLMSMEDMSEEDAKDACHDLSTFLRWMTKPKVAVGLRIQRYVYCNSGKFYWGRPGLPIHEDSKTEDPNKDIEDEEDDEELVELEEESRPTRNKVSFKFEPPQVAQSDTTAIDKLLFDVNIQLKNQIKENQAVQEVLNSMRKRIDQLETTRKVEFTITTNGKKVKLPETVHEVFPDVLFHIEAGDNVMLVGPTGCGKTELAMMIAKHLKRRFGMISWSGGITEGALYGYSTPNVTTGQMTFNSTEFIDFVEKGGLFLHDEIDGGDANVLMSLNAPLSNKILSIKRPKNNKIEWHQKFICMATANTWGNGADRQYIGRNQMDGATIKRFVLVDMDYDKALEHKLCPVPKFVERMHKWRENLRKNRLERIIDTRHLIRSYKWMQMGKDEAYCDAMLLKGWRADEIQKVKGGI